MERVVGKHSICVEPPDLLVTRYSGVLRPEEFSAMDQFAMQHVAHWPHVLTIVDLKNVGSIPPETRRLIGKITLPVRGTAFVAASFTFRTIALMLSNVINVVSGRDNPAVFFDTEEEARLWVAQRRSEL